MNIKTIESIVYTSIVMLLMYLTYTQGQYVANEDACESKGGVYIDYYCIDKSAVIELNKQENNE